MTQEIKEKTLIPRLRFPEFEGEWEENKLGEVCRDISYGMNSAAMKFDGINKYIRITDIDEASRQFKPNPITSPDGEIEDKYILQKGDIVFARTGASVGKSYLYNENDGKLLFAGFLIKFNIFDANPYFIFLQTLRDSYEKWVRIYSMRSGQPGLNAEELKSLKITFPTLPEQEKIANFLTAIDNRLQALEKKKSLLEEYKKGVMQKIFTQEIRFKDKEGKDFPAWEEKKFGEIFSFFSTNSLSRENLNYENGTSFNIHYGDIHTRFKSAFHLSKENVPFINLGTDLSKINDKNYCKEGDIIIADASEDYNDIGKTIEIIDLNESKVLAGLHTFLARPVSNMLYIGFANHLMKSWFVRKQIMTVAQGTKVLGLSKGRLSKITLKIPSLTEQTKIANFLTAIDKKIEKVGEQIEKTKTYKKGLLQQLFV